MNVQSTASPSAAALRDRLAEPGMFPEKHPKQVRPRRGDHWRRDRQHRFQNLDARARVTTIMYVWGAPP